MSPPIDSNHLIFLTPSDDLKIRIQFSASVPCILGSKRHVCQRVHPPLANVPSGKDESLLGLGCGHLVSWSVGGFSAPRSLESILHPTWRPSRWGVCRLADCHTPELVITTFPKLARR